MATQGSKRHQQVTPSFDLEPVGCDPKSAALERLKVLFPNEGIQPMEMLRRMAEQCGSLQKSVAALEGLLGDPSKDQGPIGSDRQTDSFENGP